MNKDDALNIERKQINAELGALTGLGNIQNILKPSTSSASKTPANKGIGLQKSTTVSDIGSYLNTNLKIHLSWNIRPYKQPKQQKPNQQYLMMKMS